MEEISMAPPSYDYSQIEFPVVWVGERDVRAFVDLDHLRSCDNDFLKAGHRKRGALVDKTLTRRDVRAVRVTGYISPFWGYRLPGIRMVRLDYDFADDVRKISLDELKDMIIDAQRASGMYEDMAGSPRSYEASIKRRLQSFDEVVARFRIGPKRGWLRWIWAGPLD